MSTAALQQELLQIRASAVDGRVALMDVEDLGDEIAELVEKANRTAGAQQRERFTKAEREVLQALPFAILNHFMKRLEIRLMSIESATASPPSTQPAAGSTLDVERLADVLAPVIRDAVNQLVDARLTAAGVK